MPKFLHLGLKRAYPNADALEIKLLHILFFAILGMAAVSVSVIVSYFYTLFSSVYYVHAVSFLAIFILMAYFLKIGKKAIAINALNLIVVPVYLLFVSSQFALFPPERSFFMEIGVLLLAFAVFLFYSDRIGQVISFVVISLILLVVHTFSISKGSDFYQIFWSDFYFNINPIYFFLIITLIGTLLFALFRNRINKLTVRMNHIKENYGRTIYLFPEGIIQLKISRDEHGERNGLLVKHVNPAFEEIFDVRHSEVKGKDASYLFQKLFRDEVDWQELFLSGKRIQTEIHIPHLEKWFRVVAIPLDQDKLIAYFENLTASKLILNDLQTSRHRYKLLLETIPDIFFVIDKDGTYVDYVAKTGEGLDINANEIIGSTILEVGFSKRMVRQVFHSIQTVVNHDTIETIEYALEVVGKGSCFFEMRMVKLNDNSVMAISRDITKQKLAQQAIEEARRKAEEADLLKSAFLQNISHEVRTPLNAILGFSNVILNDEVSRSERINFLQLIVRNGQILLHVFNDTIKLSRIQSGLMTVNKQLFNINGLITDLNRQFSYEKEQLGKKHIALKVSKGNDNPKFSVYTDGQKIKDIMESLIDNAIKFTREGEVEFGYQMIGSSTLEFYVQDTGIGIPSDKFDEIFERFHQLDSSMTREYGGTGIGLSLARDFANMLGSKIRVESTIGKGSRFSFVIAIEAGSGHLRIV